MALRVMSGAVLAAIAMFFWGAFYWVFLGNVLAVDITLPTADQVAIAESLKPTLRQSGVYWIPHPVEGDDRDDDPNSPWIVRHQQGPVAHIFYQTQGIDPMSNSTLGLGFLHTLVCALFVGGLLAVLKTSLCCYRTRWGFVIGLGVFVGIWGEMRQVIWMYHSFRYELFNACYDISSWMIGGAILAAIVKVPKPKTDVTEC